jgi:hypothetical protein
MMERQHACIQCVPRPRQLVHRQARSELRHGLLLTFADAVAETLARPARPAMRRTPEVRG